MKNTFFWFIPFVLIVTVIGITVIVTQDFGHEKVWVVKLDTHLGGYWDPDDKTRFMKQTDQILHYYEKQNIKIHDMIIRIFDQFGREGLCESLGGCPQVLDLFLLVDDSDVESMLNSGFSIAEENVTKPIGLYSCDIEILNQSISADNICSRDGRKMISFFQLTDNLK